MRAIMLFTKSLFRLSWLANDTRNDAKRYQRSRSNVRTDSGSCTHQLLSNTWRGLGVRTVPTPGPIPVLEQVLERWTLFDRLTEPYDVEICMEIDEI